MKTLIVATFSVMLLANSAMAFSIPSVDSLNPKDTKMKACMLQEAKQALAKGVLTKDSVDSQAAKIAASCAAKQAVKQDAETVQLAATVIKSLLK